MCALPPNSVSPTPSVARMPSVAREAGVIPSAPTDARAALDDISAQPHLHMQPGAEAGLHEISGSVGVQLQVERSQCVPPFGDVAIRSEWRSSPQAADEPRALGPVVAGAQLQHRDACSSEPSTRFV